MTIEEILSKLYESKKLNVEIQKQIDDVIEQLGALKDKQVEHKPEPPHPRWEPVVSEEYWHVDYGTTYKHIWRDSLLDEAQHTIGNVLKTKADAEFAVERLRVIAEMKEWAGEWDDPWAIEYDNYGMVECVRDSILTGGMRFASDDDAYNCIKAVGVDRIKKYYFGVPEDE